MPYIIVGLGNPGEEYADTRHNAGRIVLEAFRIKAGLPEWQPKGKWNALFSEGIVEAEKGSGGKSTKALLLEPETYMNKSGASIKDLVTSEKKAEQLVVIHDDLDLPLGRIKISFNRGSGGHKGLESIARAVKTEAFIRLRVGISPVTPSGKIKKPQGEHVVGDFIIAPFKKSEQETLKKIAKRGAEALGVIVTLGYEKAMGEFNAA